MNYPDVRTGKPRVGVIGRLAAACMAFTLAACSSFDTQGCGDKYLHVYYAPGLTSYRLVVLSEEASLRFWRSNVWDSDGWARYKEDDSPKVVFESNSTLAVLCEPRIVFTTSSPPEVNSMEAEVTTEIVEPHRLIDVSEESYDIIIR